MYQPGGGPRQPELNFDEIMGKIRDSVGRLTQRFGGGGIGLAVALVVNSGMGTAFGDLRIVRVGGAALRCAIDRDPRSRGASRNPDPIPNGTTVAST